MAGKVRKGGGKSGEGSKLSERHRDAHEKAWRQVRFATQPAVGIALR
jgi:hypothetical protein